MAALPELSSGGDRVGPTTTTTTTSAAAASWHARTNTRARCILRAPSGCPAGCQTRAKLPEKPLKSLGGRAPASSFLCQTRRTMRRARSLFLSLSCLRSRLHSKTTTAEAAATTLHEQWACERPRRMDWKQAIAGRPASRRSSGPAAPVRPLVWPHVRWPLPGAGRAHQ